MDKELTKAFDESIDELEKSLGGEQQEEEKDELTKAQKAEEKPEASELPEVEDEEEEAATKKSLSDEMEEDADAQEFLDVSPFLKKLVKGISDGLASLQKRMDTMETVQKSMGKAVVDSMRFTKSLADAPQPRKAVLSKSERTFLGGDDEKVTMSREDILRKAQKAMENGDISFRDISILEDRLNKGVEIKQETLQLLKAL